MIWIDTTSKDFTDLRVANLESMLWKMWDAFKKSQNRRSQAFIISPTAGIGPVSMDFVKWAERRYNIAIKTTSMGTATRILSIGFNNEEDLTFFLLSGSHEHILS